MPAGGLATSNEVSGMMNWVKTLVCGQVQNAAMNATLKAPRVTRRELCDLFAEELARPALRKRPRVTRKQPRRLVAGRFPCAA